MAIQILIHEPGIGLVDQTGRLYLGGSLSQVFSLIRGQAGTGSIDFLQIDGDSYTTTEGSAVVVHEIVDAVDHTVFRGMVQTVDRQWKNLANKGYYQTLTLASIEKAFADIHIPPRLFVAGAKWGAVVTALFNALGSGLPVTLGTIQDGATLTGDLPLRRSDTLASIFTRGAQESGFIWGVDHASGELYFQSESTTAAPYTVTNWLLETGDFSKDLSDYRNRQIIEVAFEAFDPTIIVFAGGDGNQTQIIPFHYDSVVAAFLTTSTQATVRGTFLHGIPAAGDTFSISGPGQANDPYTWVSSLTSGQQNTLRNQVLIGATVAECAQNMVDAINANPATLGTKYSYPTWPNQLCSADAPDGSPLGFTLRVQLPGEGGNSIAVSSTTVTSPAGFHWESASCSGGADGANSDLSVGQFSSGEGAGAPGADVQFSTGANAIFLTAAVIAGWSLVIAYYRLGGNEIVVEDSPAVAARAAIEGGTGLHEAMITDSQQRDPFTAYQQALAYLTVYSAIPKTLKFSRDSALLSPGQLLPISITNPPDAVSLINASYVVQEVQAEYIPGQSKQSDNFNGYVGSGHFRYHVTCISEIEIQTFIDHFRQPLKLTHPQPPPPSNPANISTSTPTLKPTTQTNPGTGAPTQGTPTGTAGQNWVQEQLGLAILQSGNDLVMASSSTVSSASYTFLAGDVGRLLVIVAASGWTAGEYPITSVSAGVATISGSPASSGATGGKWGTADKGILQFTWVPTKSTYTGNQVAAVERVKSDGASPPTFTTRALTPFRYAAAGFSIQPFDGENGGDYSITQNQMTLREPLEAGEFVRVEYFPAGPAVPVKHAGDLPPAPPHTPQFVVAMNDLLSGGKTIMTSPDAIAWTVQTTPLLSGGSAVAAGGGMYVMGAEFSGITEQIATSPDGITWTARSSPADSSAVENIAYGNGVFVAIWGTGTRHFMRSTDGGATWSAATITGPPGSPNFTALVYSPDLDLWVALNASGSSGVYTSSDGGATWIFTSIIFVDDVNCVTWGAGLFVAVGSSNVLMTSPDGITWTIQGCIDPACSPYFGVAYSGSVFAAVTEVTLETSPPPAHSINGISWTVGTAPPDAWDCVCFGAGIFAAASASSSDMLVMTSDSGATWSAQTTPAGSSGCAAICYG